MARNDDDQSTELSRALLALRRAAGINQMDVVARTGISQSRLSRIEQGKAVPEVADTAALTRLYSADSKEGERLVAMTKDAVAGVRDTRLVVQRGRTLAMQQRWRRMENESQLVRSFHPIVVLGVLQTPAYASVILDDPATRADRQARRTALLTRDTPRYVLIQTEGALRYRVGSAEVMVEQLNAIVEASQRPNVEFGVIPWRRAVRVAPMCGFHIYGRDEVRTATASLHIAVATLTKSDDVAAFEALFEQLSKAAVWGEDARAELRRIAADTT